MIFELLEINEWMTVEEIQKMILEKFGKKMSRRTLRNEREIFNEKFFNHETEYCIARSNKGYKKTKQEEEIIQSEQADFKQGRDLFEKVYKSRRARGENYNFKMEMKNNKLIYVEN